MSSAGKKAWSILRTNLGVILLSSGLWNLGGQLTWPFFSLYVLALGGSYVDVGIISAVGSIIQIIPTFIGGYLTDRVGRKKMVYTMSFLLAFAELLRGIAPNYSILLVAAALGAIWNGLRDPSFESIFADSTNPENRAYGYALWMVVPTLFGVLSPYIIGIFMDRYGVIVAQRWAYYTLFGLAVVASFLRYRFLEETLTAENTKQVDLRNAMHDILSDFRFTLTYLPRQLWIFLTCDLFFTFSWAICDPYFVTYATEVVQLSSTQWGMVMTLVTIINILVRVPIARASDKYGRLKFMFPAMFMWAATFLVYVYTRNFAEVLIVRGVLALSSCIGDPAWLALFADYSPHEHRGRFNAIKSVAWSITWGFGNLVGGFLYQSFSKQYPFLIGAAIQFITGFAALKLIKEPNKREE